MMNTGAVEAARATTAPSTDERGSSGSAARAAQMGGLVSTLARPTGVLLAGCALFMLLGGADGCNNQPVRPESRVGAGSYSNDSVFVPIDKTTHLLHGKVATFTLDQKTDNYGQFSSYNGYGSGSFWSETSKKGMTTIDVLKYSHEGKPFALTRKGQQILIEVTDRKIADAKPGSVFVLKCQAQYQTTSATQGNEVLTRGMLKERLYGEFDFCELAIPVGNASEADYDAVANGSYNVLFGGGVEEIDANGNVRGGK